MVSLFVIQGRDQGRRFELGESVIALGRDAVNDVQLHDTEVSRRHAEMRQEANQYILIDLGSSNGTFVNGERIERRRLRSGDRVQLGRTLMIYTAAAEPPSGDLSSAVDIIGMPRPGEESRIVHAIRQDSGSEVFGPVDPAESPWLARARGNLQIMYRTALAVSHTLDIDQLLHRIMELIFEWVEADRGCIMLMEQPEGELTPKVRRYRGAAHEGEKISISRTILDYVLEHKEGVLTSDARDDARWDTAQSIVKLGVREAICVPMQGRYGIVGIIYIDTSIPAGRLLLQRASNKFTEEHLKLMVAIAHQAALAVEDTAYYSAMVQAERLAAVGQTIASLSHHIKNILQGIRGGSYLIEEGLKANDNEVLGKGWKIVERNQERISALVMDMLTISKQREPELATADINEVAADVVELMRVRAAELGVELVWRPDASIPLLIFDPEGLHRAILNVVTNALDACYETEEGRVTVSTCYDAASGQLQIAVEDNGEGIAPDNLKKIFQAFESGKGSRGTGLGLPVSRKILQEHGGDILVESTLGKGSRFTLELPAQIAPAAGETSARGDTLKG